MSPELGAQIAIAIWFALAGLIVGAIIGVRIGVRSVKRFGTLRASTTQIGKPVGPPNRTVREGEQPRSGRQQLVGENAHSVAQGSSGGELLPSPGVTIVTVRRPLSQLIVEMRVLIARIPNESDWRRASLLFTAILRRVEAQSHG